MKMVGAPCSRIIARHTTAARLNLPVIWSGIFPTKSVGNSGSGGSRLLPGRSRERNGQVCRVPGAELASYAEKACVVAYMTNGDDDTTAGGATGANLEQVLEQVASELSVAADALRAEAERLWRWFGPPDEPSGAS